MDAADAHHDMDKPKKKTRKTDGGAQATRKSRRRDGTTGSSRQLLEQSAGQQSTEQSTEQPTEQPTEQQQQTDEAIVDVEDDAAKPMAPAAVVTADAEPNVTLAKLGSSSRVMSFEMLQLARQQSSGVLLGNLRKPLPIEFRNIDYWVTIPPTQFLARVRGYKPTNRQILHNMSGSCMPGECIAIMGPSGGGKTTLLQLLAGRIQGSYRGDILIDGKPTNKSFKKFMAFVLQDDILFSHLTVRETLTYTGLLRLPREMSRADKFKQIDYVMSILGLQKCANTKIGNVFSRGISGGERKRASIASELLTNPSIIFLDEPTSGLDATMAFNLIQTLKSLAHNERRTILCSIHQPSSQIFFSFDKLFLLADGHVIYNGPPPGVIDWFGKIGYETPKNYNPADYFMTLLVDDDQSKKKCIETYEEYEASQGKAAGSRELRSTDLMDDEGQKEYKRIWEATWLQQLWILSQRGLKSNIGEMYSQLNLTQITIISLVAGLVWLQTPKDETGAQNRSGLIFFLSVYWSFQALFLSIISFPAERAVYLKERASRSYRLSAWFVAKTLTEMIVIAPLPLFGSTIAYFMVGLQYTFPNWISFMLILIVSVWLLQAMAILIASLVFDILKSLITAGTIMLSTMLLGGFYNRNIAYYLIWAKYLSITNYSYSVLMNIDYNSNLLFACNTINSAYEACHSSATFTGPDFLAAANIDTRAGLFVGILFILLFSFRFLAYLALRFRR